MIWKTPQGKLIIGIFIIIVGGLLILSAIWGIVNWMHYLETCSPCILFDYTQNYLLFMVIGGFLVIYGIRLIWR
jgi:hypothetical protein